MDPTGPSRRFKIQKLGAYLLGALILIEPAVALLPLLHDLISAECPVAFLHRTTVNIGFGYIAEQPTALPHNWVTVPIEQKLTREELVRYGTYGTGLKRDRRVPLPQPTAKSLYLILLGTVSQPDWFQYGSGSRMVP